VASLFVVAVETVGVRLFGHLLSEHEDHHYFVDAANIQDPNAIRYGDGVVGIV
jgi:hypothetical protein